MSSTASSPGVDTFKVVPCPVHDFYYVSIDTDGRLLGRCDGCAREASLAIRSIEALRRGKRVVASR